MKKIYSLMLILTSCIVIGEATAQIAGNPAKPSGVKEWTISASGTYFHQGVGAGGQLNSSTRYFLKSSWGITNGLDLYILGGMANLRIDNGNSDYEQYEDKNRFAYGLGFNYITGGTLQVWAGANAFRFTTSGTYQQLDNTDSQVQLRRYEVDYDWREMKAFIGFIYTYKQLKFYAAGTGWYLWRPRVVTGLMESTNTPIKFGEVKESYLSGVYSGATVGIEMSLPNNYAISLEALLFNTYDMQIMVGISQTGSPQNNF